MLQELRAADGENAIPVVALVQNDDRHIQDALSIGASDYVTVDEDFYQIIEKIKMTLGGSTGVSNSTAIDITPQTIPQGDNIRVFAIEDDPLLRNLLAIRFEKSKLTFELAADAENVVAKAVAFKPQIIILDLMLPGKDGFTVLEELKQSAAADVPVLVFSNKDSHNDRKRASDLGAAAFHVKAMTDLSELITVIEKHAKPR